MKTFKQIFSMALTAVLGAAVFVSCSTFSSGINFTKPEETKKLNDLISKAITPDMLVQSISFTYSNSSSFSLCKDKGEIIYVDPDNNTNVKGIDVDLKTGECSENQWYKEHPRSGSMVQKGVNLNDFDFSKIADVVNAAVKVLGDEKITTNGIGSFAINFGWGDINQTKYVFTLQHRTGSQQIGRTVRYTYNEYDFKADKDGNLVE